MAGISASSTRITLPLAGTRVRIEFPDDEGNLPIFRLRDGARVGRVVIEERGSTFFVQTLCIDAAERSYGCGSEAGWLLVRAAEAVGYEFIRSWAPPELGLAVYFWFRMGLGALHGPGPDGGIWMERRIR